MCCPFFIWSCYRSHMQSSARRRGCALLCSWWHAVCLKHWNRDRLNCGLSWLLQVCVQGPVCCNLTERSASASEGVLYAMCTNCQSCIVRRPHVVRPCWVSVILYQSLYLGRYVMPWYTLLYCCDLLWCTGLCYADATQCYTISSAVAVAYTVATAIIIATAAAIAMATTSYATMIYHIYIYIHTHTYIHTHITYMYVYIYIYTHQTYDVYTYTYIIYTCLRDRHG